MKKTVSNSELLAQMWGGDDFPDFERSYSVDAPRAASREDGPQLLLTVEQAKRALGIGRSHLYKVLARGELKSVKIGGSRRIPAVALDRYIEEMMEDAEAI